MTHPTQWGFEILFGSPAQVVKHTSCENPNNRVCALVFSAWAALQLKWSSRFQLSAQLTEEQKKKKNGGQSGYY